MSAFAFSFTEGVYLEENPEGCFLISEAPIRILRLNWPLFSILKQLQTGIDFSELIQRHPETNGEQLLNTLVYLTSRGYLKLKQLAHLVNYPRVSVTIPVRNQSAYLTECLMSLANMNFPKDKLEVIIVDDGSSDNISDIISSLNVRLIRLKESSGPATARNIGAGSAHGDILAFLDADCIADVNWLQEIIPFFQIKGIEAIGGFVDNYYKKSYLDRYEEVSSSLNMGARLLFDRDIKANIYVPTCNMLVTRKAFLATGGFKGGMRVGEDVDFCWRMRNQGFALLYVPFGRIYHKHRNQLLKMLRRRGFYGSSEALLYFSHRNKRKRFTIPIWGGLSFLAISLAILLPNPYPLIFLLPFFLASLYQKTSSLKRFKIRIKFAKIVSSALRGHFSFYYSASIHLMRYYFILLFGLGFLFHPVWLFCLLILLLTSIVDYQVKKPHLLYPIFLYFYVLEHLAYQTGVFWGCLKLKYFGSYIPEFSFSYS